jgi:N-acetylneuraminic acid mutarotase
MAYVIGGYSGMAPDGNILSVNAKGKISVLGHLAVPVRYPAVAALGNKIYVFGGQQVVGAQAGQPTSAVQEIDTQTGSVSVMAHLPAALMGAQAIGVGKNIILCGGDETVSPSGAGGETQSAVWLITPNKWKMQTIGNLPTAVSHAAIIVNGNAVWLFGGEKDGVVESVVQGFRLTAA